MGPDKTVQYYPFPNDISIIGNNGERYPVPEKTTDWHDWMKMELIEKEICSEEILYKTGKLSPLYVKDGRVAKFGPTEKRYQYLHAIKNEPGHNYIYRVWLQFLYDEMVLGKRSPRVLRLASYGEEYERTHTKWNELSNDLSTPLSDEMNKYKRGYVLKDIFLLSEAYKKTNQSLVIDEPSMVDMICSKAIKTLISTSQDKKTSEWSIYRKMKRKEVNDWFDEEKDNDEETKGSDFKNKKILIKHLIDSGIKPPGFDIEKERIERCFPCPVFINTMVNFINSQIIVIVDKIIATRGTVIGELSEVEQIFQIFNPDNPEFGKKNRSGNSNNTPLWNSGTLGLRIKRAAEMLTHEILRILVCELKWISLEKGNYEDLEAHYNEGNNDKIIKKMKSQNKLPNMCYLTKKLIEKIPPGAGPERKTSYAYDEQIHANEAHSIFRFMARSTRRWMYCEPEDHSADSRGGFINPNSRLSILGAEKLDGMSSRNIQFNKEEWNTKWPTRTKIGSEVCNALNSLQKTQWEVNFQFLDAVTEGFKVTHDKVEYHAGHNKFVLKDFIKDILFISEESTIGLPKFRVKELKEEIQTREKEIRDILASCHKAIRNGDNVFWHPWACDYRGRFNTVNKTLSPQGSDFSKAIIRFKEWKPLGEEGWKWFKIHVCNLLSGIDFEKYFSDSKTGLTWDKPDQQSKKSFASRAEWTEKHLDSIIHISENLELKEILELLGFNLEGILKPKNELFQRLSVILEFKRIVESYQTQKDWSKVNSGMPIHLDASCNGFQHAAALLQNRNLAKKVNLIEPDSHDSRAEDLYREVAEYASKDFKEKRSKLRQYLDENKKMLGLNEDQIIEMAEIFDRNLAKRPTMVVGYGGSNVWKGIISGKDDAPPPLDKFKESDWDYMYGFREKDARAAYEKIRRAKKKGQETLHTWLKKQLPDEDISKYNSEDEVIEKLIQNQISPPEKHICFLEYCPHHKQPFDTMKDLKKHVKKHKVPVWHPESPLYKSVKDEIKDKINKRVWPSKIQTDFAEMMGKDIEKSIKEVTYDSFGWIGKNRLQKVQAKLRNRDKIKQLKKDIKELKKKDIKERDNSAISEKQTQISELIKGNKLLAWKVLGDSGTTITNYQIKKGDGRHIGVKPQDARRDKFLLDAYEFVNHMEDQKLDEIFDKFEIADDDHRWSILASDLLKQLILKEESCEPGPKLDATKQLRDYMFNIAYHLEADRDEKSYINSSDYGKGIIPNFVHSLDAAHMRNVINSMAEYGIDSFWSVHDSFGTHAADIGKMREIINKEFVELHKIGNINWWCKQMYPEWESSDDDWDWDKLDLDEVLESEFLVG